MSFLEQINSTGYEVITAVVIANAIAQLLKTFIYWINNKEFSLQILFTTGGMPSSHSSSVVAMATSIALLEGFDSMDFAMAFAFAAVVLYDAAGVRRAAGRQAAVLNTIMQELFAKDHKVGQNRLKELLGHSPKEVIAGALLGIVVSVLLRQLISA
jgi:uncharacterized protein